jgi:enoyl-CoA hydratase
VDKPITLSELQSLLYSAEMAEDFSPLRDKPYVLVSLDGSGSNMTTPFQPSCPVITITNHKLIPEIVDVAVSSEAELTDVINAITRNPIASMMLVQLLRHNDHTSVGDALFAESLAYSTLQHGGEFQTWLENWKRSAVVPEFGEPLVLLNRTENELEIKLNRPHKRNAYSAGLRDALCDALQLVLHDATIETAILRGAGTCFSAGGDLDEFGEAVDAARAHVSRVECNAASLMHALRDRLEVHLHGACIGAGIELPAFSKRVFARSDAFFQLPEVSMGLIPGAGGTAGILSRIGRLRLAFMALTGTRIDAPTALEWGLIDNITD